MSKHEVRLEISGPSAMWTRPDTGDAPVSYPAPTFSAAKGIFESILRIRYAEIVPTRVEICRPVVYHTYTTNYGGPLRESSDIKKGASFQLLATVLVNVCYRLYATPRPLPQEYRKSEAGVERVVTGDGAVYYLDEFNQRLSQGRWFTIPCLGWREFVPDYVGPFREGTRVCADINLLIPSMLQAVFSDLRDGSYRPTFDQNVVIKEGVLRYAP